MSGMNCKLQRLVGDFAPAGYTAVVAPKDGDGCTGCHFATEDNCGMDRPCAESERPDGLNVIFIPNDMMLLSIANLIKRKP